MTLPTPRILIVGPDPSLLISLADALQIHLRAAWVATESSLSGARDAVGGFDFDLLIMDYLLAAVREKDQLEDIRRLRPRTPILLLGGEWFYPAVKPAYAFAVLEKPFIVRRLLTLAKRAIRYRHAVERRHRRSELERSEMR